MATIYRFIVEQKTTASGGRKSSAESSGMSKKSTAKKGRAVSILGGSKGGVEHNRTMRAVNPLINKMTGGWWERGNRVARAGAGLIKVDSETGKFAGISMPAVAILIAFVIKCLLDYQKLQNQKAEQKNRQNFKQLENGFGQINGMYEISTAYWTGRQTYNQNK